MISTVSNNAHKEGIFRSIPKFNVNSSHWFDLLFGCIFAGYSLQD